jgi:AcrR family transcriptional regulator
MKNEIIRLNSRQAQAEKTRQQLQDTALDVFARQGFKGTTTKDIALAAGVSPGLMYHYFSSKDALLEAIIGNSAFSGQLKQILVNAGSKPVSQVFLEIAAGYLEMLKRDSSKIKIIMHEVDSNPIVKRTWSNIVQETIALLKEYIEVHIAKGDLRPHEPEVTARTLFGIIFMFHFTQDIITSSVSRENYINVAVTTLLQGITVI